MNVPRNDRRALLAGRVTYRSAGAETRGNTLAAGTPELLFSGPFDLQTTEYTIMPDGTQFIMVEADPIER